MVNPTSKQQSWFPSQSLPPAAPASYPVGLDGPPRSNILPQQGNLGQNTAYGNPSGGNLYPNPVRDMAQGDSGYIPAVNGQVQGYPGPGAQNPPARMGQALPPTPYGYNTPTASPWSATPEQIARRNYAVGSRSGLFGRSQPKEPEKRYSSLKAYIDSRYAKQYGPIRSYLLSQTSPIVIGEDVINWYAWNILNQEKFLVDSILQQYGLLNQHGKWIGKQLNWNELADIVDFVANTTHSDEEFRLQLWLMFGTDVYAPLAQIVSPINIGLPRQYHNTGRDEEQFHHYLGGVTGDLRNSHLYNNPLAGHAFEVSELLKRGSWNQGDIKLFQDTEKHRDDFLKYGRHSVGPNIRRLLKG